MILSGATPCSTQSTMGPNASKWVARAAATVRHTRHHEEAERLIHGFLSPRGHGLVVVD